MYSVPVTVPSFNLQLVISYFLWLQNENVFLIYLKLELVGLPKTNRDYIWENSHKYKASFRFNPYALEHNRVYINI